MPLLLRAPLSPLMPRIPLPRGDDKEERGEEEDDEDEDDEDEDDEDEDEGVQDTSFGGLTEACARMILFFQQKRLMRLRKGPA